MPFDQLHTVQGVTVMQDHSGHGHLDGIQIVFNAELPGDEEQKFIVVVNITAIQLSKAFGLLHAESGYIRPSV